MSYHHPVMKNFLVSKAFQHIVQRASFSFDSGERAFNTEAGVAVRNRSHIVMFDKLVFLESVSLPGKRRVCFYVYQDMSEQSRRSDNVI